MYVIWDCICGWFMFNPIKTFSTTAPTRNIWQEQVSLSATVTRTTGIRKGLPVMEHMSTMLFGSTAQTRRLRQPRPAAAAAADQNIQFSSKSDRWGRWKSKESRGVVAAAAADMWCLVRADVWHMVMRVRHSLKRNRYEGTPLHQSARDREPLAVICTTIVFCPRN